MLAIVGSPAQVAEVLRGLRICHEAFAQGEVAEHSPMPQCTEEQAKPELQQQNAEEVPQPEQCQGGGDPEEVQAHIRSQCGWPEPEQARTGESVRKGRAHQLGVGETLRAPDISSACQWFALSEGEEPGTDTYSASGYALADQVSTAERHHPADESSPSEGHVQPADE